MEKKRIECKCGHIGFASYREKDNAYSSYGIWTFTGFLCGSNTVEKPFQMSFTEALSAAKPVCPECGSLFY